MKALFKNAWVEGKGQAGIPGVGWDGLMSEVLGGRALPNPDAECPLIQMLTSGTTGQRKRILRTHGQIMSLAQAYQNAIDGSAQDRILAVIPLSHGHGFCSLLLNTLQSGATLFLQRSFDRRKTMGNVKPQPDFHFFCSALCVFGSGGYSDGHTHGSIRPATQRDRWRTIET